MRAAADAEQAAPHRQGAGRGDAQLREELNARLRTFELRERPSVSAGHQGEPPRTASFVMQATSSICSSTTSLDALRRAFRVFRRRSRRRDADLVHARSRFAMAESGATKVQLHVYDLSQGMARAMSAQLLGKQIEGVWHTGIIALARSGTSRRHPTRHPQFTHFGRPLRVLTGRRTCLARCSRSSWWTSRRGLPCRRTTCCATTATTSRTKWRSFSSARASRRHPVFPDEARQQPFGQQLAPMLSMMDAQMRTASEGASWAGSGAARRSGRRRWGPRSAMPALEPRPSGGGGVRAARGGVRGGGRGGDARGGREGGIGGTIKAEFAKLVAQGRSSNEAAAAAVRAAAGVRHRSRGAKA